MARSSIDSLRDDSKVESELIQPRLDLETEFMAMVEEFRAAGETRFDTETGLDKNDFPAYVRFLENGARGIAPGGLVPWSAYWLMDHNSQTLVGVSSLRHTLSPFLKYRGGHVGYAIRPSQRRRGYGTLILKLTLEKAKQRGLERVLVVCHTENIASVHVIEQNGGKIENEVIPEGEKPISRYWINLD